MAGGVLPSVAESSWTPAPELLEQLGPYQDCGDYQIRVPKGYRKYDLNAPLTSSVGGTLLGWGGPLEPNGTRPVITVLVLPMPLGASSRTREQALDEMLRSLKKDRSAWQQTPTELGEINGLSFARANWTGLDRRGLRDHRTAYAYVEGRTLIEAECGGVEPNQGPALELGNAAILTLRKK